MLCTGQQRPSFLLSLSPVLRERVRVEGPDEPVMPERTRTWRF
jgi:hypothetical protein